MRHPSMFLLIVSLLPAMALSACAPVKSNAANTRYFEGQPGATAIRQIQDDGLSSQSEIVALLKEYSQDKRFRKMMKRLPEDAYPEGAELLQALIQEPDLTAAAYTLIPAEDDTTRDVVKSAFVLFPLERYPLYYTLLSDEDVNQPKLAIWAKQTDVLPAPSTAGDKKIASQELTLEPLIESVAVSVSDAQDITKATVRFREKKAGAQWQIAQDLISEPVQQLLTGAIVNLKANTEYDVEVALFDDSKQCQQLTRSFTTRPDSPPIDSKKVYKLSDIYDGGTLDLEELGIEGTANGWAKIVGDADTPIVAEEGDRHAIFIGDNAYVYFENITVKGGRTHAVRSTNAHHIWINQCDISGWGRAPNIIKNGRAFEMDGADAINYDSALYFERSGVITVENCHVHDPKPYANSWEHGHPKGPNAFLAYANHPDPQYKGQIILRNNRFVGKPEHRFNDVIEGRKNGEARGGFVRNSAIYNNVLAFSNDDVIEIDGGQHNVLVYNNDISHGYTGISATPTRIGPSYIFNNYIHDLGDQNGKQWAALKVGGLLTAPAGQANLFHNLITVQRNGIGASRFQDDSTFWLRAQNNIIITEKKSNMVGYTVYDPMKFTGTELTNNYLFNLGSKTTRIDGMETQPYVYSSKVNEELASSLFETGPTATLPQCDAFFIENFTRLSDDGKDFIYGISK